MKHQQNPVVVDLRYSVTQESSAQLDVINPSRNMEANLTAIHELTLNQPSRNYDERRGPHEIEYLVNSQNDRESQGDTKRA